MTSKRFFISSADIKGKSIELAGDEHYHLSRVVRIRQGAQVILFDEKGRSYKARVENSSRERTRLRLIEEKEAETSNLRIVLAQAVIKSRNMEMILQKGTELGVAAFIPLTTRRNVMESRKSSGKTARWERILREAMKQSGRTDPPEIRPLISLSEFLEKGEFRHKILLWERKGIAFKKVLLSRPDGKVPPASDPESVSLLIGPEGGWTDGEYRRIMNHGYTAVTLGRNVLRSETAAIAGVAMIAHFWNL